MQLRAGSGVFKGVSKKRTAFFHDPRVQSTYGIDIPLAVWKSNGSLAGGKVLDEGHVAMRDVQREWVFSRHWLS